MIEFQDLSKSFSSQKVLISLSGKFENSKVNLIIGVSGGGKSVFLKCLVGLLPLDNGKIFYDGVPFLTDKTKNFEIKKKIGMLFQGGALFDSMNTEKNVMFPLDMLTNLKNDEKLDRVNFCIERVGLKNSNKKMPSELSGGMKKRVAIARAIVNNPKYLFCDEPNSGLDPKTSIMIDELIKEITYEYKITTVVVTHDINSIISIGDYIFFLENSKKSWEGSSKDIISNSSESLKKFLFSGKLTKLIFEKN
jgi:phospholipid/cholesterol/gamma-HCH transport system ATP-binding protein